MYYLWFPLILIFFGTGANAVTRIQCGAVCQNTCFNYESVRSDSKDRCECGPQFCRTETLCKKYRGENYVFDANAENRAERCLEKEIAQPLAPSAAAVLPELPKPTSEPEACNENAFQYAGHRKACIEGDPGRCLFSNSPEGVALAIVMSAEAQSRQFQQQLLNDPKAHAARVKAIQDLQNRKQRWETAASRKAEFRSGRISRIFELISVNLSTQTTQFNGSDVSVDEASKKILRREFPNEMPEIEQAMDEFRKAGEKAVTQEDRFSRMDEAFNKFFDELERLAAKGAKLKAAIALATRSNYAANKRDVMKPHIDQASAHANEQLYRTQDRIQRAFQTEMQKLKAKQELFYRKATLNGKLGKAGAAGLAAGGAAVIAFAPGIMRRSEIESCKSAFDLTESDLDYLKGNFSPDPKADMIPRAEVTGADGCQDLTLSQPLATYYELKNKYGTIPPGICKILQKQVMRMEEKLTLPGEVKIQTAEKCEDPAKSLFTVDYSTPQGVRTIKAPYIDNGKSDMGSYPQFFGAKVYDDKGQYLPLQTQELIETYHRLQNPRTKRPDLVDYSFLSDIKGIPQIQIMTNLIKASHRHRDDINRNCTDSDSKPDSQPAAVPVKTER